MMSEYLLLLIPYFSLGMLGLAIQFKLYKRSITTCLSFIMIAISSNLFYYGIADIGTITIVIVAYMVTVMVRAICKTETDKWFQSEKI